MTRDDLAAAGKALVLAFCHTNGIASPTLHIPGRVSVKGACGLYDGRKGTLYVDPARCARLGYGGPAWSWPGYIVDRTPYGVCAHEMGHHIDHVLGYVARKVRGASGENRLTGYCPNSSEWFAEMCRLYITNPALLQVIRPATYNYLASRLGLAPVETRPWRVVLNGAPARTVAMAARRVGEMAVTGLFE